MENSVSEIKKILIANRAEIAIRVMKTCREMKIKTVAVYTPLEATAAHVLFADESVCLGEGALSDTYLNVEKILELAQACGADAIHPGYGLLSENALFANRTAEVGLTFIGPNAEIMQLMGDKKSSKDAMAKINIPLIPGFHGEAQDSETLLKEALKIDFPIMIKASAGGGGKGMRVVHQATDFKAALDSVKREALSSFACDRVLIEKYIENPRHIEVQVMSDTHGGHWHFFERECSIQRRHQKIVEETPAVSFPASVQKKMTETALTICRGINYLGAGTIEFILDSDDNYYFLEMNTRLQVEHTVTELVTNCDLVRMQIQVAQGEKLNLKQSDIIQNGHSMELRLYAEDPDNEFLPSIGTIGVIGDLTANGVRLDTGYKNGSEVTIDFDPMLAKLIVHAPSREIALAKLLLSLDELVFLGVKTNREYLKRILKHAYFVKGEFNTHFIVKHKEDLKKPALSNDNIALAIASFHCAHRLGDATTIDDANTKSGYVSAWDQLRTYRN